MLREGASTMWVEPIIPTSTSTEPTLYLHYTYIPTSTETHFWVRPSPRLVCSDRPEGRVLSCLDPPATQAIPAIRVRGSGISVKGPALRAVPVNSRLHQSRGGIPCPPERMGCAHSQLP